MYGCPFESRRRRGGERAWYSCERITVFLLLFLQKKKNLLFLKKKKQKALMSCATSRARDGGPG
jgi:hypothetical protein